MSTIGIDALRREQEEAEEWESNSIKRAIQIVLKETLNNEQYRKKTVKEAYAATKEVFFLEGVTKDAKYATTAARLLRKLERSKTISEAVLVLGDYLLS